MVEVLLIVAAAFIGAVSQRTVGLGVAIFLVPIMLIYFSGPAVIMVALLIATVSNLLVIFAHKDKKEIVWPVIIRLFITALPGLIIGAIIVTHINKSLMQIIVGAMVIIGVCIQEFVFPKPTLKLQVSKGINPTGFIVGILNSTVGVTGPVFILWFRTHICTANQIRHNLATIFTFINVVTLVSIYVSKPDVLTAKSLYFAAGLVPVVLAGNFTGQMIVGKINKAQFERILLGVVIATGATSMIFGMSNL